LSLRVLLVGHGRMGRLIEGLAPEYGVQIAGVVDRKNAQEPQRWPAADVAIDFSVGDAVPSTLRRLAERGTNAVIGTTGWQPHEAELREVVARHKIGVVAAPNFAVGVNLFVALVERAAELMRDQASFGAYIHELHHAAKRDAPSGTALALDAALKGRGYSRPIDVSSTRAGSIPGTHTVGFDSPSETITLTHTARDRSVFARGALEAAKWIDGKSGWFTMKDALAL
jgi:4-hydroxy-tetrahydrodipicolinate reductase